MGAVPSDGEVPLDAEKELVTPAPIVRNMGVPAKARASTAHKVTPTVATHNGRVSAHQPVRNGQPGGEPERASRSGSAGLGVTA